MRVRCLMTFGLSAKLRQTIRVSPMFLVHANRQISLAFTGRFNCERSSFPGRRRRAVRWKFDSVVQIVR